MQKENKIVELRKLVDRAIEVRGNDVFLIEISNKLLEIEERK
jgi:hypothetical protein